MAGGRTSAGTARPARGPPPVVVAPTRRRKPPRSNRDGRTAACYPLRISSRLRHRVDERKLSLLHDVHPPREGALDVVGVEDGAFTMQTEALREHGEVRGGLLDADTDAYVLERALPQVGDRELVTDILIVGAVIEHDHQHGDVVVGGGPQRARRVQEVAVVLDADADLAGPTERERHAHRDSHSSSRASAAGDAARAVRHFPEPSLPAAQGAVREDPVVVLNDGPDL